METGLVAGTLRNKGILILLVLLVPFVLQPRAVSGCQMVASGACCAAASDQGPTCCGDARGDVGSPAGYRCSCQCDSKPPSPCALDKAGESFTSDHTNPTERGAIPDPFPANRGDPAVCEAPAGCGPPIHLLRCVFLI